MDSLRQLAKEVSSCKSCFLYKSATQAVPGEGNPQAKIMLIGEAPGFFEDKQGRPFVGQAGKFLDSLVQLIKLAREDVFITNLVKHRPPQNRDPLPSEIEACRIWLDKQIEIVKPEIIVTLGRFSMAKFLPGKKISQIHGTLQTIVYEGKSFQMMPMYHPAAGLRDGGVLRELKSDFIKLGQLLI